MDLTKDLWYIKRVKDQRFYKVKNFFVLHSSNKIFNSDFNFYGRFGESDNSLEGYNGIFDLNRFQKVPEITLDEFLELTEPFVLPEKYYIKKSNHPDYQRICDYFQEKSGRGYEDLGNYNNLCYNSEWKVYKGYSAGVYNTEGFTEVSVEDFVKHVLNKETKMEQKLTRRQLITLYNADSCSKWKEIISQYVTTFSAFDTDDVTRVIQQSALDLLIKEGTDKQKKLVTDLGIILKEDKNAFVKRFGVGKIYSISQEFFGDQNAFQITGDTANWIERKDLKGKSFVVSDKYDVNTISYKGRTIIEITKK